MDRLSTPATKTTTTTTGAAHPHPPLLGRRRWRPMSSTATSWTWRPMSDTPRRRSRPQLHRPFTMTQPRPYLLRDSTPRWRAPYCPLRFLPHTTNIHPCRIVALADQVDLPTFTRAGSSLVLRTSARSRTARAHSMLPASRRREALTAALAAALIRTSWNIGSAFRRPWTAMDRIPILRVADPRGEAITLADRLHPWPSLLRTLPPPRLSW